MLKTLSVSLAALAATFSMAVAQPAKQDAPSGGPAPKMESPGNAGSNAGSSAGGGAAGAEKASPAREGAGEVKRNTEQTGDNAAGQKRPEDHERADKDKSRAKGTEDGALDKSKTAGDNKKDAAAQSDGKAGDKAGDGKGKDGGSLTGVTPEQKTKAKSAFSRHRVEPAKINISVNVGVAIPRDVRLYAVPEDIVVLVPAYRKYRYFIVDDRVCIVDPVTFEIVDIIVIA